MEESIGYGLTNSYYTVQAIETVRKDLNAKSFEKEYQQLKERGFIMNPLLSISKEVQHALDNNLPVVALESTIISHGMPYPQKR